MFACELHETRPDLDDRWKPGDEVNHPETERIVDDWVIRWRKKYESMGEKLPHPNPFDEAAESCKQFVADKLQEELKLSENKPDIEEVLASLWQSTGQEHCRCCLTPKTECYSRRGK